MEVKTDTKEKFTVIRVQTPELTASMAAELSVQLQELRKGTSGNIVLNLGAVKKISEEVAEGLVRLQQNFYEANCSFVICELDPQVETFLDHHDLLEMMNVTLTESEAGDIVQMEEIERDLLNDEEDLPATQV